jgi:DNA-binding CsgD family transcriptional regulator
VLLNRDRERDALDGVLNDLRMGLSAILVLHGEAGIGKSALLGYAVEAASGMQVARVVGVESEMEFGFAALHQLLMPFLAGLDELPPPQREALRSAFGLAADGSVNHFLIGLATLTLLAGAATERPLLCVVDDAQWLDRASAHVLAFVARRLLADRIGMLFGVRDATEWRVPLEGLANLHILALPDDDARRLLRTISSGAMDPWHTERILAEARGNPLALVELGGEATPSEVVAGSPLEPLPLSARLEQRFLRRVQALSPGAQTLLLTAAADASGDAALVWRAAAAQGVSSADSDVPGLERLLSFVGEVHFRHPLMRSAVYHGAPVTARRRAHQALAIASDPRLHPDHRAWHLAQASVGPDEQVAAELERSAERARQRGGWAANAAFLVRAAALTPDEERRAVRRLHAADAQLVAGAPTAAADLLEQAMPALRDPHRRAEARRLEAWVRFELGESAAAPAILLEAAKALGKVDVPFSRQALLEAWEASLYAGQVAGTSNLREIARFIRESAPPPQGEPSPGDLLLDGLGRLDVDYAGGVDLLRSAIARLGEHEAPHDEYLQWLSLAVLAAFELWDEDAMEAVCSRGVRLARERGALTSLLTLLRYQALAEQVFGRYASAEAILQEAQATSTATGNVGVFGSPRVFECTIVARRGQEAAARETAAAASAEAIETGQAGALRYVQSALAVLEIGLGNYAAALDYARRVYEADQFPLGTAILPDLIVAASRSDEPDLAAEGLARLSDRAQASGTRLARGILYRSRALVADDEHAGPLYVQAVEHLKECRAIPELARAHLLYGEWLRRQRRRREAREELRAAREMFTAIGAEAFAERARLELLATGERIRRRTPDSIDVLTPQEAQIARLASEGASNLEIATQLFVSSSTVAYHLRKVFRKLGVSSRAGLAAALREE